MKTAKATTVRVTRRDIRTGQAGDCYRCPVAVAVRRATGDTEANVYERDWEMWLEVHGRHTPAPAEVVSFIWAIDSADRTPEGQPVLTSLLPDERPKPFSFALPPMDDPEWQERCYVCEELFDPAALDGEGCCAECRD